MARNSWFLILGLSGLLLCFSAVGIFATDSEPVPDANQIHSSLEGRIVWCRNSRDLDVRGFRFDDWVVHVNESKKPYVSVSFLPRFLRCSQPYPRVFIWQEDAGYRAENILGGGMWEKSWIGESLVSIEELEFPELNELDLRLYLRTPLKEFFNSREWKLLRENKTLVKKGTFFPWPRVRWDGARNGIPEDVFLWASWYELEITFELKTDPETVRVAKVSSVFHAPASDEKANKKMKKTSGPEKN